MIIKNDILRFTFFRWNVKILQVTILQVNLYKSIIVSLLFKPYHHSLSLFNPVYLAFLFLRNAALFYCIDSKKMIITREN